VAKSDDDNMADCWGTELTGAPKVCHLGPRTGYSKRIFAIGDSHGNALIGVYRHLAEHNNWRVDVTGVGGCYLTTALQTQPSHDAESACTVWRGRVTTLAQQGGYDAIIVTHSSHDRMVVPGPGESTKQATVRGLVEAWQKLPKVPIVAIRDNPSMTRGTMNCVAVQPKTAAAACAVPRSVALAQVDGQAEAVPQVDRAHLVDMTSFYCTGTVCSPVIGHVLVYRDVGHITSTYSSTLSPYLEREVVKAIMG
jgi:hypothetical protein